MLKKSKIYQSIEGFKLHLNAQMVLVILLFSFKSL